MRVLMKTRMAGPDGNAEPGQTIDLSGDLAQALIAGGYAMEAAKVERAARKRKGERATAQPQREEVDDEE